jgi:hypothetical protein
MNYTEKYTYLPNCFSEIKWLIKPCSRIFTERVVPAGIVKERFAILCDRQIYYRVYVMLPSVPVWLSCTVSNSRMFKALLSSNQRLSL